MIKIHHSFCSGWTPSSCWYPSCPCTRPASGWHSISPSSSPPHRWASGTPPWVAPPSWCSQQPSPPSPSPSCWQISRTASCPRPSWHSSTRITGSGWWKCYAFGSQFGLDALLLLSNSTGHLVLLEIVELVIAQVRLVHRGHRLGCWVWVEIHHWGWLACCVQLYLHMAKTGAGYWAGYRLIS